jgi:hypothetical protein
MKPYQKRVIDEKDLLDEKLDKLNKFIESDAFDDLKDDDRKLLIKQEDAMSIYSDILEERIDRFQKSDDTEIMV